MTGGAQNYQLTLNDLEARRKECREELQAVEMAITGLKALMARDASLFVQIPQNATPPVVSAGKYAGMSVRWAVLQYFSELPANSNAATSEIASALLAGGMTTSGRDFSSNVSAVISVMVSKRAELAAAPYNRYTMTEGGYAAWDAIKKTPQYRERIAGPDPTLGLTNFQS